MDIGWSWEVTQARAGLIKDVLLERTRVCAHDCEQDRNGKAERGTGAGRDTPRGTETATGRMGGTAPQPTVA